MSIVVDPVDNNSLVILVGKILFDPLYELETGFEEAEYPASAVILVTGVFRIVATLIDCGIPCGQPSMIRFVVFCVSAGSTSHFDRFEISLQLPLNFATASAFALYRNIVSDSSQSRRYDDQ
jgi:hypothetical protein